MTKLDKHLGRPALKVAEYAVLLLIAVATIIAIGQEVISMVAQLRVHMADLLLLFIYLEILAMVGAYLDSGQLPVRMPLYIGMVALARYLVLDLKEMDEWRILSVAAGALLLAIAVLVVRYGHAKYPYIDPAVSSRDPE